MLVIGTIQNISSETIHRIRKLAVPKPPIVIAGEPGYHPGKTGCHETCFCGELISLRDERNVHSVRQGQVAPKLRALKLGPQISSPNPSWYTTWRTCRATGSDQFTHNCSTTDPTLVARPPLSPRKSHSPLIHGLANVQQCQTTHVATVQSLFLSGSKSTRSRSSFSKQASTCAI